MSKIESPCVRNCCLDDDDICMGCHRTLDEIKAWSSLADDEKQQVLERCELRNNKKNKNNSTERD